MSRKKVANLIFAGLPADRTKRKALAFKKACADAGMRARVCAMWKSAIGTPCVEVKVWYDDYAKIDAAREVAENVN